MAHDTRADSDLGVLVPHWLLMRDARILPLARELWRAAGGDRDRYVIEVHEWVTTNVHYCTDAHCFNQGEYVSMPYETATQGYEDCDGSALLMVSLLWARGVPAHMALGYARGSSHRWVEALWRGELWVFDTTNGDKFQARERRAKGYDAYFEASPWTVRLSKLPLPPLPVP